ncbi:MAG: right-handed parallel beta-helix repeat-containing protein [Verrucomicrobiota bacterium]
MRFLIFVSALAIAIVSCSRVEKRQANPPALQFRPGTFFVATNGNDQWSGALAGPEPKRNDGPYRTVARALRAVGELKQKQGGDWKQPVTIFVRGGPHWLDKPLQISHELSGTREAPLLISAYSNEHPVLSAGQPISDWKRVAIDGRKLWSVAVTNPGDFKSSFHQLWVDGQRRIRARHPNTGYFQVAALPDATPNWEKGHTRFQFSGEDLKAWPSAHQGDIVAMTRWVESRLPITNIDEKEKIFASSKRSVFQLQPGDLYYVEGVFEVLDQPGEWFFDREQGLIYYQPMPGEILSGFNAVIPRLADCLHLDGQPELGQFVEHVEFRGLAFSHNEWFFPAKSGSTKVPGSTAAEPEVLGFPQAAFGVPGAVNAEGARNCSFENCQFVNLGSYGLQLGRGCQSNVVSACKFFDLAAGGIRIGETIIRTNAAELTHGNQVVDCDLHDGGKMFQSGEGIWIGQSFGNQIAHNSIFDFFYTGISIGWTWGYGPSLASNNVVEFNHVHHIGRKANGDGPVLSDMGGIYTLGGEQGTVIRNNLWHHIAALRYGGWAIYFDEGSTGIVAENNIAFRTTHGGFHQHYGKDNIVRNNIFALARDHQLQRTRAEEHTSFTFERNLVYFDHGKLLEGDWTGGKFNQDGNVYFDSRTNGVENLNFPGGWEKWRAGGYDEHSLIADPRFASTNLAEGRLEADSPALKLGFKPIDLKDVGPRPNKL